MAIDPERLLALDFPEIRHEYGPRDCILYALGLGCGLDPMDEAQLRHVDERKLAAVPTMANVLAYPGFWMRDLDTGIDWVRVVHGEHETRLHRPLPVEGAVIGRMRIVDIIDKGRDRGALIYVERTVSEAATGEILATLNQTVFCRGDGGFGGKSGPARPSNSLPDRPSDRQVAVPTHPQLALIYRLSGDTNPLHSDPETARLAGFERPILHGLATFGIAGRALVTSCCGDDPARFRSLAGRFSAPVYPGETIAVEIWDEAPGIASYRARAEERDVVVLTGGRFEYRTDG